VIPVRAHRALTLAILTLLSIVASAHASLLAAGATEGAWIITTETPGGPTLLFIDPKNPGIGLGVTRFRSAPVVMSAGKDRVVAAFAAETVEGRSIRPLRMTSIEPGPNGLQVFSPVRALPPLPTGAPISGIAVIGRDVAVLTLAPRELWICDGANWTSVPLPNEAGSWESVWIVDYLSRIGLCTVDGSGRGSLWTADPPTSGAAPAWARADIAIPPDTRDIIRVSSHLVALHPDRNTTSAVLSLLRPGDSIERARIETTSGEPTIAALGDRILIATPGSIDPLRADIRTIGLDGKDTFSGPLKSASPLSTEDVQLVVFGVMGIVLAAMVFALRSEGQGVVRLPEGTVLATPNRRFWATLIDLIPGIAVGWIVGSWQTTVTENADPIVTGIAAGFLIALIHAVIGEAMTGRTIGKAILGIRTVGPDGKNPSWPQALGRNLSKLLYPPLGLLILLNPAASTPGSCGTIVVMNRPPTPASGDS